MNGCPPPDVTGKWGYRRAPGTTGPDPDAKPEIYGLAAVYHRWRMMEGRSEAWVCPAARPEMRANGNTYAFLVSPYLPQYRRDSRQRHKQRIKAFVWDNYEYQAGVSGQLPYATESFNVRKHQSYFYIPIDERHYPHVLNTSAATLGDHPSSTGTNGLFFDGHVALRAKP